MSASLIIWSVLFFAIVILPIAGWLTYRCLNWRGWLPYTEPQGNRLHDALAANPWRRG